MNTADRLKDLRVNDDLRLELTDDRHAEAAFALIQQSRDHLSEWLPWVANMQILDNFRDYIHRCKRQHQEGTDYGYMIISNGKIAGRIGIHYIHLHNRSGAIGYWLGKGFEGKGIITKACAALINHCYAVLQLNRIEIKCGTGNLKSAAIPERLGFTKEGILRQAEYVNGGFIDLLLYSMLREEWNERF